MEYLKPEHNVINYIDNILTKCIEREREGEGRGGLQKCDRMN